MVSDAEKESKLTVEMTTDSSTALRAQLRGKASLLLSNNKARSMKTIRRASWLCCHLCTMVGKINLSPHKELYCLVSNHPHFLMAPCCL